MTKKKTNKKPRFLDFEIAIVEFVTNNAHLLNLEIEDFGIGSYEYAGYHGVDTNECATLHGVLHMTEQEVSDLVSNCECPANTSQLPDEILADIPCDCDVEDEFEVKTMRYEASVVISFEVYDLESKKITIYVE